MIKRPPFPESSSQSAAKELESMVVADDLTGDILDELKNLGFGAVLETVTVKEPPSPSRDEVEHKIFMEAKDVYLGAGRKHMELGFKENAAMNFSCAILCIFLAKDEFAPEQELVAVAQIRAGDGLKIFSVLPNPVGPDAGNEIVRLVNTSDEEMTLGGWKLTDLTGKEYPLSGTIKARRTLEIRLPIGSLILNNIGDDIRLINTDGILVHSITYSKARAGQGIISTL